MDSELQKAVKNIESTKLDVKHDLTKVKSESQDSKPDAPMTSIGQMFQDGIQRVISQNHQMSLQVLF